MVEGFSHRQLFNLLKQVCSMSPLVRHALSAALALSFNLLPAANAAVITEHFTFSGAVYGNSAVATGSLTFDYDNYVAAGNQLLFGDVTGLTMTISGATSGNGTFTKADFQNIIFNSSAGFDWSQPTLIGQNGWGPGGDGAFSFVGLSAAAPNAWSPYDMTTNGGFGNDMVLTSITSVAPPAPVPEPETYMLLAVASAALAYTRRRNNKQQQGTAEPQPSSLLAA